VTWFGADDGTAARSQLAVVFDATAHADELSARENLAFFATARAVPASLWERALNEAAVDERSEEHTSELQSL
jgi:ABC-type multidrug transport system ATPase subunit